MNEAEKEKEGDLLSEGFFEGLPLFDEQDKEILMHRDVHFSGSFGAMVDYYSRENAKGKWSDIDAARIEMLDKIEKFSGKNLAPLLLSGVDAEKVGRMRKLYRDLRAVADQSPTSPEGILAESILSEEEVDEIVRNAPQILLDKPAIIIPFLLSEEFADPLSPGYGLAPLLAAELLGKARYPGAIKNLFQCIGAGNEELETAALSALRAIGDQAKEFSKKILVARPITSDTERAALVLTYFLPDEEISSLFRDQLADPKVVGTLRQYLSFN